MSISMMPGREGSFESISPATVGHVYFSRLSGLDGNGRDEFLTGVPNQHPQYRGSGYMTSMGGELPRVRIHDRATGAARLEIVGSLYEAFGTVLCSVGDVDGDGLEDIGGATTTMDDVVGFGATGFEVCSSAHGGRLWSVSTTTSAVARVGDVDGDGLEDLPLGKFLGVEVRSGGDGSFLWSVQRAGGEFIGTALDAGDWNGDGFVEVRDERNGASLHLHRVAERGGLRRRRRGDRGRERRRYARPRRGGVGGVRLETRQAACHLRPPPRPDERRS